MEVYLVRHTEVAVGKEYCYGISDVDLAQGFESQLRDVKNKLASTNFSTAYTSPLKRCKLLADVLVKSAVEEQALLEMSLGEWELHKWSEIDQAILDEWMKDFVNMAPPGADNFLDFSMKSVMFFDEMAKKIQSDSKVLLVTHSGVIRSIVCHVLNLPLSNAFHFEIDYGSVTRIDVMDGSYRLKYLNH